MYLKVELAALQQDREGTGIELDNAVAHRGRHIDTAASSRL
jgi:hypothetical protein